MRLLVLGGTGFLSRAVAATAIVRGHDVTAVHRGRTGTVPDGVTQVLADRGDPMPPDLAGASFDAVVDVSSTPSHVRRAVATWPDRHWVFVSTVNVYADDSDPGGPGVGLLREPETDDVGPASSPDAYGRMKVACEQAVLDGVASAAVVRPGLIVGPGDPTGRFTYWPARMLRTLDGDGADALAPGKPSDPVQVIDVRDLAAWIVTLAERRGAGVLDAVGPVTPIGDVLDAVARGCGAAPRWRWADGGRLAALDVRPWAGDRSLPLWLPRPDYAGMVAHDAGPALAAGLEVRPVEDTSRDVLAWLRSTPDAPVSGLTAAQEAEVLAALR
ncbi:NAD-dependent epimerase/dehydratase family protein [Isoptericola chiayiensis]|uniref:NAD-dependent epimerase/dehydratase family protein n=1 Tax=Isoptericola chiayiensis TaxID=579446 RepID=UPI0015582157|nr:NAD-dependent epimerase/dehydratase family protein [Isoptericola chiayiensis]NOW01934.1 nucleoside-diphosphate-sugar epimerase [Isoptericola chiayiensis]